MTNPRLGLPNSARRLAKALGFSEVGIGDQLPNTLRQFARLLGKSLMRASYPNTLEELQMLMDGAPDIGGGGGYTASAVRIDGDTNTIERAAALAGVAESPVGMFSLWRKAAGTRRLVDNGNFLISQFGGGDGLSLYAENSDASEYVDASFDPAGFNDNAWHNLLMAWDADHVIGERVYQFYLDDVSLSPSAPDDSDNPCIIDYTAANWAILVGGSIFNMTDFEFDVADLFFAPGQYLDLSVEANRRKFISADGKPVDLGADGSTPTGTAPAVFFSGDATGFASNKGSGGAFVFTGALANAPTSPSD